MDFMDNLKKAVTDTANAAAKKTGELVETSKIKYSMYDLKNEIEKIYTEIGRELYIARGEDRNISDSVMEKCEKIDALNEQLGELKSKLENN